MKKSILLTVVFAAVNVCAVAQLLTNSGSILFNENKPVIKARNWAIRQNNTAEGYFQIGFTGTNLAGLPDFKITPSDAKLTIKHTGNVGIGTVAPFAMLDVRSEFPAQGTLEMQNWGSVNDAYNFRMQSIWDNSGISYRMTQRHSNVEYSVLTFYQGNVGIGINTPGAVDAKLAVKGMIHCQEVKVDLLGGVAPDYVFEKQYDLMPLNELQEYIDENKHLPEIPSAVEMEKDGVMLKEMNMMLLKKVEELTLYILEQEKRIKALENK